MATARPIDFLPDDPLAALTCAVDYTDRRAEGYRLLVNQWPDTAPDRALELAIMRMLELEILFQAMRR
jgi:hypothetical protein